MLGFWMKMSVLGMQSTQEKYQNKGQNTLYLDMKESSHFIQYCSWMSGICAVFNRDKKCKAGRKKNMWADTKNSN